MEIQKLVLENFRNYEHEEIEFSSGTNVIYGDNAQGKTNLLEAVCLFARGKSRRAGRDAELVRFGEKMFRISLNFSDSVRQYRAVMQSSSGGRKIIKINNVPIVKLSQLMSYLNIVMFSPEELEIVKGSPAVRRRFMDEAISQLYPKYISKLSEYHKALEQKNSLLRQLKFDGKHSSDMLSVWNQQIAESGATVVLKRRKFLEQLSETAELVQKEISKEILKIDYTPSVECGIIEEKARNVFFEKLENAQRREIENGAALFGVQRDDFKIKLSNKEAKLFASQGQQRTAVLSMKLAQTECIFEERGEYPVLLLDDIMSELDINRRQFLSGRIKDKQVLITSTDAEGIENNVGTKYFKICNGRLERNVSSFGK